MLAARGIEFSAHELPEEKLGATEAAAHLGVSPELVFKSIVALRPDGGKPVIALVSGDQEVDLKALGRFLGSKKLSAASQKQAEALTGLQTGGISPLVLLDKGFEIVIDEAALGLEKLYLSGGKRGLNISMTPSDLLQLNKAKSAPISKSR